MPTFPTLSQGAAIEGFTVEPVFDPTLVNQMEAGVQTTRPQSTVVPRQWRFRFSGLTDADKTLLDTFFGTTVRWGGTAFDWENTDDGSTYSVYLKGLVSFSRLARRAVSVQILHARLLLPGWQYVFSLVRRCPRLQWDDLCRLCLTGAFLEARSFNFSQSAIAVAGNPKRLLHSVCILPMLE